MNYFGDVCEAFKISIDEISFIWGNESIFVIQQSEIYIKERSEFPGNYYL